MVLEFSPIKIFLSYSQNNEDVLLKEGLTKHLLFLKNKNFITLWGHSEIQAGEENEQVSTKNLFEADIILLLMSPDFIASDSCNAQMKEAIKRYKKDNICVMPILLRPVYWQDEPINILEILPKNTQPITLWPNSDEAFLNVTQIIKEVVYNLLKNQYMKTGEKLYADNYFENALAAFEQAIQIDAKLEEAYLWVGKVLNQLGQHANALAAYEQAIRLNPNNAGYYAGSGYTLFKLNKFMEALASYKQATKLNPENADFYREEGNIYWQLSQYEEAIAVLEKAILLSPKNADIYFLKASCHFKLKQYEVAFGNCQQAIRLEATKASYWALQADLYEKLDQNKKALEAIKKAIALDPKKAEYYVTASNYHWYLAQYEQALLALEVGINLDSNIAKYYELKANHLLFISKKGEIYRKFSHYNFNSNSNWLALYNQMVFNPAPIWLSYFSHTSYNQAIDITSSAIIERALEVIEQAIKLDLKNFEYYFIKSQAFFLLNRYHEAIVAYDKLLSLDPSQQQRKRIYQHKIEIYNTLIKNIRDEANLYGIKF